MGPPGRIMCTKEKPDDGGRKAGNQGNASDRGRRGGEALGRNKTETHL